MRPLTLLLVFLIVIPGVFAQESTAAAEYRTETLAAPRLEISSHSGSPLLLDLSIFDPDGQLTAVRFETPVSTASYRIPHDPEREIVQLSLVPFLEPGVYDVNVELEYRPPEGDDTTLPGGRAPAPDGGANPPDGGGTAPATLGAQIGFVDFVFGRDNFRFGNNADYESVIGTYGEILAEWIDDRFGEMNDAALVALIDYMYGVFGKRSGRCYAFAGSELRFWLWPDLLPSYYDDTYDLRAGVYRTQMRMNYLQLDMAYNHFITGGYALDPEAAAAAGQVGLPVIQNEVWRIMARIASGEPVVVGFIGPQLHHAMLVYGYIRRPDLGAVDLLVSNNWKSDQDLNLRSRNAEAIRVFLETDDGEPAYEWHYLDGTREREIERLFVVEVLRDYEHERETLDRLTAARLAQLRAENRALVVVEQADGAWLTNGQESIGRRERRTVQELEGVFYDKVNDTYRFEYDAGSGLWLEIVDDEGARVLHYHPGDGSAPETAWVEEMPAPEEGTTIHRRINLESEAPQWEIVAAPE